MIRRSKPVQLLEWGKGSSQANQNWTVFAKGNIQRVDKSENGGRIIVISVGGDCAKSNVRDDSVKITQEGQGMTPTPGKWGEVAFGRLKDIKSEGGGKVVEVEVKVAVKVGR